MAVRIAKDKYFTNSKLTQSLLDIAPIGGYVFEPCCGEGHILKVLRDVKYIDVVGGDIDIKNDWFPDQVCIDSTNLMQWRTLDERYNSYYNHSIDWVVSNPPYTQPDCQKIIDNAWQYASVGVAMLLRLSYLEPCLNRRVGIGVNFLRKHP